ncbi:type 1 fimbrial protein [Salmonella enterica]|nr:hypothetical protein [Salmonella enterica]EFR4410544.1 type 1 fimbrial protein [Salmonella enterica]EGS7015755.1 type 1 fimbrial protein [Salmonella enterica]EHB8486197.1 type 1 fimbrial protein [Salmonella enterica]
MNRWMYAGIVLIILEGAPVQAMQFRGQTTFSGEVLASACAIALEDRFQVVSFGDLPLREVATGGDGRLVKDVVIRLEHCSPPGKADLVRRWDPALRVRFEGTDDSSRDVFRTQGDAGGVVLELRDDRRERVIPGQYLPAVYHKSHDRQVMKYQMSLIPDGRMLQEGAFSAALRFRISYE